MADVLSWLQSDNGYFEDSDMFSSEASSSPRESVTGDNLRDGSPFLPLLGDGSDLLFSLLGEGDEASCIGPTSAYQPGGDNLTSRPMPSQPLPGKFLPYSPTYKCQEEPTEYSCTSAHRERKPGTGPSSLGLVSGLSTESTSKDQSLGPLTDRNRKNAESARLNRQKKKMYLQNIEGELESLKVENKELQTKCGKYESSFKQLVQEVDYLRSVIRNQSTLSSLLQNIPNTGGVQLKSTLPRKRSPPPAEGSPDQLSSSKRGSSSHLDGSRYSGGVCLHVARDNVCIEFCSHCSKNAGGM